MKLSPKVSLTLKILVPVAIGIGVVIWLFGREFNLADIARVQFTATSALGLLLALVALFGRDFGLAWRFRALTDRRLRWGQAARVTMLCEFTSAITPTTAGGSALSMIFISREGVSGGRATAVTLTTLLLDEAFFVVFVPLVFLLVGPARLFGFSDSDAAADLQLTFWIVYGLICAITLVLFAGIFIVPGWIAKALVKIFSLPLLRRWRGKVEALGDDIVSTSHEIRGKRLGWWSSAIAATAVSWVSRFLVVNALFLAFCPEADQMVVFGRQFIVWALLMYTPTPGGAGVSEMLFKTYYSDLIAGPVMMVVAVGWRILSYYIYLLIGFCMIPTFLNLAKAKTAVKDPTSKK